MTIIDQRRPRRHRHRTVRGAAATLAACAAFAATGADAKPVEQGSFHDVGTEALTDFCGTHDFVHHFDVSGSYNAVTRGRDGLVHYRESVHGTDIYTNAGTGRSVRIEWTSNSRDQQVTDNGDGTLTILVQASGGSRLYDGAGVLRLRDPGMTRWEILIDDAGTPNDPSDDEFLDFLGIVKGSTGRNDTEGRDFCEDLLSFTG